jgi:hypothetical protein
MNRSKIKLSAHQALAFFLKRQYIVEPSPDPLGVIRRLGGVQTQVDSTLPGAIWRRSAGATPSWVRQAFTNDRSIIKIWTLRQTLHTVEARDLALFVAAVGRYYEQIRYDVLSSWSDRSPEEMRAMERALLEALQDGPLSYEQMRAAVPAFEIQSYGRELKPMVFRGDVIALDERRFAARNQWLPELPWDPPAEADARRELVRRYLSAYGPASVNDFAHWAGLYLRDVRPIFEGLETVPVEIPGWKGDCLLLPEYAETAASAEETLPPVLLLPKYDVVTLAHKDKTRILDEADYKRVYKASAHVEAVVLVHGRVAATWRQKSTKTRLKISISWFRQPDRATETAVETEAESLAAFYGLRPELEF